jgi:TIR domain
LPVLVRDHVRSLHGDYRRGSGVRHRHCVDGPGDAEPDGRRKTALAVGQYRGGDRLTSARQGELTAPRYAGCVNAGDRVELLRKLAGGLSQSDYPWEDMELVLRQFGFRLSDPEDDWGSQRAYVLNALESGGDEALVELDEYLFGEPSRAVLDPALLPWESGTFRLFVSHTSANAGIAGELRDIFSRWRMDAFVAHTTIEATREWERVIEAALGSCHALTALVTEDFIQSRWCDQEVGYCLARKVPIVPVRLGADPHGFISKFQAARVGPPGTAPWLADASFRALARHAGIRNQMAAPVVHRYAGSTSFDGARVNFELLRDVPTEAWTRELVEIAERAAEENTQIAQANVLEPERKPMPEAAAELLEPIRETLGMNASQAVFGGGDISVPLALSDDDIPF